jgi:hypothetical protein
LFIWYDLKKALLSLMAFRSELIKMLLHTVTM